MIGSLLAQRYRIDAKLGEGGMGVVYKAHDALLDRPVAIKTLSPLLLGAEGLKRLLREAQSAAKLAHPNIVAVHDVVEDGETRLIVMEYVAGPTLRERIPLSWPEAAEVAVQVCRALAHAHAQGVVHRDIKPENVILTPQGVAKVTDFGLARSEGRSRLTQTGMIVGTVAYMAPEQALQGRADARSDLYALGCVLYELVTGRAPFEAEDPIAVITQHINVPPVAPRFHQPDIPPALEGVTLRLLAKDPEERFRSAEDVSVALEGLRAALPHAPAPTAAKVAGAELVQSVQRGILVGRDAEVAALKHLVDQAAAGDGRVVVVSGQVGVGKTRLVEEAITYAHLRGVRVLSARCYEGGTPYEPVARMLRDYLRQSAAEAVREALGDYAGDLARLAPEVRQKLGTLPESLPLPPDQERARLFEAVTRLFATLSQVAPLLLFVDDLHLADPATLQLLRYAAPAVVRERLVFVAAYQPEEAGRAPILIEMLRQWQRERWVHALEVKPLAAEQVEALIQAMAHHPRPPVHFARRIYEVTEGNPYFIEEVINALFEAGTLYLKDGEWSTDFDERARYAEMPVPATVRSAIETRLGRLTEEGRGVLLQAAVLGRRFNLEELAQVAGVAEDALLDLLDRALGARLVREVRVGGEDRYEFVQSMVREVLYDSISRHRRRRLHLRVAETLERLYGAAHKERAGEIADHFLEAGEEARAVPYLTVAGERAEGVFAHEEAIRRFEAARELLGDMGQAEDAVRLLEVLGEPYLHSGQPERAVAGYQQALDFHTAKGDRRRVAELRRQIGHVYHMRWDFARAIPLLEQALAELGEEETRETLVLYLDLARAHAFSGAPDRAVEWGERALRLAESLGALEEMAQAHLEIGTALSASRDYDASERHLREAARLARQGKGYLAKTVQRRAAHNLAGVTELRGDLRVALDGYTEALRLAQELAQPDWEAFHRTVLGQCLYALGEWQKAREHWERAVALGERGGKSARRAAGHLSWVEEDWQALTSWLQQEVPEAEARGDVQTVGLDLEDLAYAAVRAGAYSEAEAYARRALVVREEFYAQFVLAEALARQGRAGEAGAVCEKAAALAEAMGGTGIFARVHYVTGLTAAASGDAVLAEALFRKALGVLERHPRPYLEAQVFEDLGDLYGAARAAEAMDAYRRALEIHERIGAPRSPARVRAKIEALEVRP